jgi:hypothetical protein
MQRLLLVLFLCASLFAQAQVKNGLKLLPKKQYTLAQSAFEADLENATEQACAAYYLAELHSKVDYVEGFELPKAFGYIEKAIKFAQKANPKARKLIEKRGLGLLTMRRRREDLINQALDLAEKTHTAAAYDQFIGTYTGLNVAQTERIAHARNRLAFDETLKINTGDAWERFWQSYRESLEKHSKTLAREAEKYLFEAYIRQHSWGDFYGFAARYEDNPFVKDSAAAIKMQMTVRKNSLPDYKDFLRGYPKSPFAKIAIDSIFALTMRSADIENYDYFTHSFPNYPELPALWKAYFPLFCREQTGCPDAFSKKYPQAPR